MSRTLAPIALPERPAPRARGAVRPRAGRARAGFTLIELLVCVVIVGLLAAFAIPKFSNTKARAHLASMKSDLHNLVTAEETYFYEHSSYTSDLAQLNTAQTKGVTVRIVSADSTGWAATSQHPASVPITCAVYYGRATPPAPATVEGVIACQ